MNDISDNPYLKSRPDDVSDTSLRSFLFTGHNVAEKTTGMDRLSFTVKDMLSSLGFSIHREGFKYLSKLVEYYLVKSDYSEDTYIARISDIYGVSPNKVKTTLLYSISRNGNFIKQASRLLDTTINVTGEVTVTDAIEICGAIYVIYYNYVVKGDGDTNDNARQFNFKRDIVNGCFFRKTDKSVDDR